MDFKGRKWREEIDVRDFVQENFSSLYWRGFFLLEGPN